jgi:hypothetical protein
VAFLCFFVLGLAPPAGAAGSGFFSPTGSMSVPRSAPVAAALPDGRVLVAGGDDFDGFVSCPYLYCPQIVVTWQSAEIFDPATGSFAPTGSMTVPRSGAAAAPLPDGRVLVVGGNSAEIFDAASGSFSPTGAPVEARSGAAAAPLPDGRVLVAGGGYFDSSSSVEHVTDTAEIFDPATGSFSPTGRMTVPRVGAAAAPLPDGRVLVAGGGPYDPQGAEIFDPATGSFTSTGRMTERLSGVAAPLPDGRVLVIGGNGAEIFDPASGSFSPTGAPTEGRGGAAAAPLPDGRVLVAGGYINNVHSSSARRSAELFTPALSLGMKGKKLTITVAVAGTLTAADIAASKRERLLKRTSASGGPGPITLKLRPTAKGERRLGRKGKLRVTARISFAPRPVKGKCATVFSPCYSSGYAMSETTTLTLKAKRQR